MTDPIRFERNDREWVLLKTRATKPIVFSGECRLADLEDVRLCVPNEFQERWTALWKWLTANHRSQHETDDTKTILEHVMEKMLSISQAKPVVQPCPLCDQECGFATNDHLVHSESCVHYDNCD